MFHPDTELLFPLRAIPGLSKLRGDKWRSLIKHISSTNSQHAEKIAFVLMMVRLDGCVTCNTHSFRAMRGCSLCAQQAVRRYKGSDDDLLMIFEKARFDVKKYIENHYPEILNNDLVLGKEDDIEQTNH